MSKRILVVCQHFWPEQFRVNDIVDYWLDQGFEVDVLCGRPNYPSGTLAAGYTLWNRGVEKYRSANVYRTFEIPRGNNSSLKILVNYLSFPISSLFLVPRFLNKKYDRVFLYQLSPVMMSLAGIIISKLTRTPSVMYVLDLWPENLFSVLDIQNRFLKKIASLTSHWYYRRPDKLVVLSERMRSHLLSVTGKPEGAFEVVPQVAEKLYETPLPDASLESRFRDTFNIVFTGNISPAQSFGTMIDAARILKEHGLSDVRWVIVGDGMSRHDVEREIAERGLTDCFVFEGHHPVQAVPKYTYIADVLVGCLVQSELLEATVPAKVMSYIASGRPIVLSMDGEVQSLINDEIRCGFAGDAGDAVALAANIEKLYNLSDPERYRLGENAREYHFRYFERDTVLARLTDFVLN